MLSYSNWCIFPVAIPMTISLFVMVVSRNNNVLFSGMKGRGLICISTRLVDPVPQNELAVGPSHAAALCFRYRDTLSIFDHFRVTRGTCFSVCIKHSPGRHFQKSLFAEKWVVGLGTDVGGVLRNACVRERIINWFIIGAVVLLEDTVSFNICSWHTVGILLIRVIKISQKYVRI